MTVTDTLRRKSHVEQHASHESRKAREFIETMPETVASYQLVLDALISRVTDVSWGDMSLVRELLADASDALDEVSAYTQEELNDFVRERFADDRADERREAAHVGR